MGLLGRKARRDLLRARGQFAALTAMIVLGVGSLTAIYGGYANLQEAIQDAYEAQNFHDGLIEFTPRDRDALPNLSQVAGVSDWEPRRVADLPVSFGDGRAPVMARLITLPEGRSPRVDQLDLRTGELPAGGANMLLAEAGFGAHHGLEPGARATIQTANASFSFSISGTATSPEYFWPAKTVQEHMPDVLRRWGVLWIRDDDLERVAGGPGSVNQVVFTVSEANDPEEILARVATAIGTSDVVRLETRESQASNVNLDLLINGLNQIAFVLPLLFLTIVGLSTYVLLTRLVHQQRPNIGLLRALGYAPRTILWHYLSYAPLIAGLGTLIGFGTGYALSFYVTSVFASYVSLSGIGVQLRPDLFLMGLGLSLGFTLLASVLPAAKASRMLPAEAMRPPTPRGPPHARLDRMLPGRGKVPFSVRMGLRSVARNPRRAAFTALGMCLAVGVMIVPLGFLDSMDYVIDRAVVQVQRADETLIFREPVPVANVTRAAQLEGVAALEPLVQLQSGVISDGKPIGITIIGLGRGSDLLRLYDPGGRRVEVTDAGIQLSRVFERSGHRIGDTLTLFGEEVPIVGFVQATGTTGFVTLETAQRWAGIGDLATQALLKRDPGAAPQDVHDELASALPLAATQDVAQALADTRSMLRLYYGFIFMLLAFAIAIGAAIVFNAVTINVMEESRDFATLRTLGMPMRSLFAITTTETLLLAVPGVLAGLWLGKVLTGYFVGVFSSDLFVLDLFINRTTYGLSLGIGLAVAFLSQIPSVRWIGRMDLAKSVRERAA